MSPHTAASPKSDIAELLAQIDVAADVLHADYTPAVWSLIDAGRAALPGLLALMDAADDDTRLHAQRAFEGVLMADMGFVPGRGFEPPDGEAQFRNLWAAHGSYDWDASPDARKRSLVAWRHWLDDQGKGNSP